MADSTSDPRYDPDVILFRMEQHLASIRQAAWWTVAVLVVATLLFAFFLFGGGAAVVDLKDSGSPF
jgi:hypothetical protein